MSDKLIRLSDALAALDWGDIYGRNAQQCIAALPAVTVGVKPLVWQRMPTGSAWDWQAWCDLMCSYYYAGTDAQKREHEAVRSVRILSALEPVAAPDPAVIREAALREAADLADTTFSCSGTDAARIIRDAILALIKGGPTNDRA